MKIFLNQNIIKYIGYIYFFSYVSEHFDFFLWGRGEGWVCSQGQGHIFYSVEEYILCSYEHSVSRNCKTVSVHEHDTILGRLFSYTETVCLHGYPMIYLICFEYYAFNPLMPNGAFNIYCPRDCVSRTANEKLVTIVANRH